MTAQPATNATTIEQARAIANAGLRVLPIKPGRKNPPMASWQDAASIEERTIAAWWNGLYRDHGIGIAMGPQPDGRNLFAIDIDTHDEDANGYDTWQALEEQHGPLPDTVESVTGSGGSHIIYQAPSAILIRNQQSAGQRIGPGVDVRGKGGQIVVAPTIHPDTKRVYQWAPGRAPWEHEIAMAPRWLLDLVAEPPPTPPKPATPATTVDLYNDPDESPADALRRRWDWAAELDRTGWQPGRTDPNGDTYYTRPGKNPRDGHSAVLHGTDGPFVVFTTEIPATLRQLGHATTDGSGFAYSPLEWYAAHNHNGNLSDATRALRADMTPTATTAPTNPPDATHSEPEPSYDDTLAAMLINWSEFWDMDHKAAEWLAEPILAQGRSTAIFAPGGTGKSLLSLYMAACIATGRKLFGRPVEARNVLYLDYEMTADDLAERLEQMGFGDEDLSMLHYALLPSLPGLDEPEGGKAVVRMAEMVDAQLVVIDTFGRAVHGDENDADTVRSWYRWTGLHLKHDGRAFLRVDHAGKDTTKGQRGTSAKNDDVDVVWEMRAKEAGTFTLIAKKRRMGWVPMTVDLVMSEHAELRFDLAHGHVWPKGTAECAKMLDALGVDVDCSVKTAREAIKDAGRKASSEALSSAVKYRKEATSLYHFAGADPVDNRSVSKTERHPTDETERQNGTPERNANPLVVDAERETERRGTPSDADTERSVSIDTERSERDPNAGESPTIPADWPADIPWTPERAARLTGPPLDDIF